MLAKYEDEVICDLAEYYHIYDLDKWSAYYIATLVKGLRHNSRLATSISGHEYCNIEMMIARIIDELTFLSWTKTKDARTNSNRPKSLLAAMQRKGGEEEKETRGYDSGAEFEKERARILQRIKNGG